MIEVSIPGRASYVLQHLVLDLNGTLTLEGELLAGVEERLQRLKGLLDVLIATADTYGTASRLQGALGVSLHRVERGHEDEQKAALVRRLGGQQTVAIGNGANDVAMLKEAAVGICIVGGEGAAGQAVVSADIVVTDINAALDLLLNPKRLVATLRR